MASVTATQGGRFQMLRSFKGIMGMDVEATDGSLGNAIRFFVDNEDFSLPLVMVGGGRATTGELMVPTKLIEDMVWEDSMINVSAMRRSIFSSGSDVSRDTFGVFDALRLMGASVSTRGEDLGVVIDLMVETDQPWNVKYLVVAVDGRDDREVLLNTEWISKYNIEKKLVDLDVDRKDVNTCPECDLRERIRPEYEIRLSEHYNKPVHLARFG
ncbi:MAG: hypothetical protein GWN18_02525 [Thermoplasmata archaeon]|nr:hypothetical protein [Thermoplasmata archaeon]NIS21229.1 hypothetical protein [Thermoplasmata archaeon]NIV79984.1 hypothetical protein [Thermoplasmata archaeon]NIW81462.1 hypothetical protein [Thermoplasmata archaeon]